MNAAGQRIRMNLRLVKPLTMPIDHPRAQLFIADRELTSTPINPLPEKNAGSEIILGLPAACNNETNASRTRLGGDG